MQPIICTGTNVNSTKKRDLSASDAVYYPNEVKTMAVSNGGYKSFTNFITANIDTTNLSKGRHGAVVYFMVEKDGSIRYIKTLVEKDKYLGSLIAKAIEKAPIWIPATNADDKAVRVQFAMPYSIEIK